MSLTEKAAYLRGLYDGLELKDSSKEAKLLSAIIDVLEDMAGHITENEESITSLADQMDDVAEDLADLEEALLEDEDDDYSDLLDDEFDEDDDDYETVFEVECPKCKTMLTIDDKVLAEGEVQCDSCGQRFSVDLEFEDEDDVADDEEIPF